MSGASQKAVSSAIGDIYQAAYDHTAWSPTIDNLRRLFHGSKACLVRFGPDGEPSDTISPNSDPAFQDFYMAEFANKPNILGAALAGAPVGLVYSDHAYVGRERLRGSRFWNEWMAPQDMYGGLSSKLMTSGSSCWFFDIQRGRKQEEFDSADLELFALLAPHIRRSIEIGRQLQLARLFSSTFSHLPFGILLVDRSQRILTLNEAAATILAEPGNALRNRMGFLVAADPPSKVNLRQLIMDACSCRDGFMPGRGGDFQIASKDWSDHQARLVVSVGPLPCPHDRALALEPCAVVVIRKLVFELPDCFAEELGGIFDLTPKEARLAAALAGGVSLKEAARDSGIQLSTARTHLGRIFRKTRTDQQSQLVALLKNVQPLLRRF